MMANKTPVIPANAGGIARAAQVLREGGLVAVPTETVYGLAARADDAAAVARIYSAKGRPGYNPLIVHIADRRRAEDYAHFPDAAKHLVDAHWPGPLTLVLPQRDEGLLAPAVTAGLATVALRMPAHPVMQALLREVGVPLAAPSANRSGFVSPTTAAHVLASLDARIDLVLDGGACAAGLESTIIAVRADGRVEELRPGPISGLATRSDDSGAAPRIEAPGQLASHYSPGKPVRLEAESPQDDEFMIGFGTIAGDCTLSPTGDLQEAAARLYDCLYQAAHSNRASVAIAPVPATGIGAAINDRLRRAAA